MRRTNNENYLRGKAVKDSASALPLYRNKKRLEMRIKVKKIRNYYNRITKRNCGYLTNQGSGRFRFFVWDDQRGKSGCSSYQR